MNQLGARSACLAELAHAAPLEDAVPIVACPITVLQVQQHRAHARQQDGYCQTLALQLFPGF